MTGTDTAPRATTAQVDRFIDGDAAGGYRVQVAVDGPRDIDTRHFTSIWSARSFVRTEILGEEVAS